MYFLLFFIILLLVIACILYNNIINSSKKVEQAKSTIDVYLKQRFDLIPNLCSCIKEYTEYESETLEKIISMRNEYLASSKSLKDGSKLNLECEKLLMVAESYPKLKANEQFLKLQQTLIKLESQLQAARRIYNSDVTSYNTKISTIPTNIIAGIFGFKNAELFSLNPDEKENVNLSL